MYHMTTVSVRDLRYDFPRIENLLRQGEEIQITKRGKVIAHLVPELESPRVLLDFLARAREIYGDKVFEVSGAEIIRMDRDRF
jgi:antitoxin (DNA-binding transcriptional repressor) of toxin-antitoxin stability system